MNKTLVDIGYLEQIFSKLKRIDSLDFDDIVWVKDGETLEIPNCIKEDWVFMGLNNTSFVRFGIYKEKEGE